MEIEFEWFELILNSARGHREAQRKHDGKLVEKNLNKMMKIGQNI